MSVTFEYMDETSIDPELICSICHLPLTDPYCTPCSETFCYKCIRNWIQTPNASCPHCRRAISTSTLTKAPRSLRNMLDRLTIKCLLCEQNALKRVDFDEHIQTKCPKTIISCPAADIKCPWIGPRGQLNQHLATCHFEPMRPVINELIIEIQQLKDLVDRQTTQMAGQKEEISQSKQRLDLQITQNTDLQQQNAYLRDQITQLKTCLNENQQSTKQMSQKDMETTSISSRSPDVVAIGKISIAGIGIERLKGTWEYVGGENTDEYLREIGFALEIRKAVEKFIYRLVISENNRVWTIQTGNALKLVSLNFTPDVEFTTRTAEDLEIKSTIRFEGNKWIQTSVVKNGKEYLSTRYVDDKDQQIVEMECGSVKARRWYKRAE